jgi:2-haloacid dehalogenase
MKQRASADAGALVMSARPSAIVFDVGRVLFDWDLRCLYRKLIDDSAQVDWFVANVVTERWHHQHDEGRDLAEMVAERIEQFPDHAELIHAYATRFNETVPGPVAGMAALVERLAAARVPLFALTNFADKFWREFRPLHSVFDHFRDIVVSGVEKLAKPDPAIFRLAERRFGQSPEALFFIDDNAANVAAARECGWDAWQFTDSTALERELVARDLLE